MYFMQHEFLHKQILCVIFVALDNASANGAQRTESGSNFEIIVSVYSGYFLYDIRLDSDVLGSSPRWDGDVKGIFIVLDVKTESREGVNNLIV